MIFGLTGGLICAGRSSFSDYLVTHFGFKKIDIFQLYIAHLKKEGKLEEQKSEDKWTQISNQGAGVHFFTTFYSKENRDTLINFINPILSDCRADWKQNYVVYPLPLVEEL